MSNYKDFYINGAWVAPAQPRDWDVIDPATEDVCAIISLGDQADTDADEKAVKRGVIHCMSNTGQSWNAPTRMLVEQSIYDETVAQAVQLRRIPKLGPQSKLGAISGQLSTNPSGRKSKA